MGAHHRSNSRIQAAHAPAAATGQVVGTEPAAEKGRTIVHAEVPQTELSRYAIDLRSVSHGTGLFTRSMIRYDYMPAELAAKHQQPS